MSPTTHLPNGLLLQWGSSSPIGTSVNGTWTTVNFAISFSAVPFAVLVNNITYATGIVDSNVGYIQQDPTVSSFIMRRRQKDRMYWMAVGKA